MRVTKLLDEYPESPEHLSAKYITWHEGIYRPSEEKYKHVRIIVAKGVDGDNGTVPSWYSMIVLKDQYLPFNESEWKGATFFRCDESLTFTFTKNK